MLQNPPDSLCDIDPNMMFREAKDLHRININENALGLMPDKAINLMLNVQRKRNSMNA